jgi:hypothetical protein
LEALGVFRWVAKIEPLDSVELKLRFAVTVHLHWNDALARVERPALFSAADVGLKGPVRKKREHHFGAVECVLDFFRPAVAGFQALAVQPYVEALRLRVLLQPRRQIGAVGVGVGDEDTGRSWDRHGPLDYYARVPGTE